MNRSILIVMFDFIVLSMLSMITGLSTLENPYGNDGTVVNSQTANVIAEKLKNEKLLLEEAYFDLKEAQDRFGYSQARSEAMQKIEAQLAATDIQLEIMEKRDITNVDVKESASLSNDAATLPTKYKSAMSRISGSSGSTGAGDSNILDAFEFGEPGNLNFSNLKDTKRILGYASVSADDGKKETIDSEELQKMQDAISRKDLEIAAINKTLKAREADIAVLRREKVNLESNIIIKDKQINKLTDDNFRKDKVIIANKHQLNLSKRHLERKDREVTVRKQEVKSVQRVLTRAVTDLSKTRAEAEKARKIAQETREHLVAARENFVELRKRIEGNVLDYYDRTVQNLRIYIEQERFLANKRSVKNLYLPVIKLENKFVVISLFKFLAGGSNEEEFELENVLRYDCKAFIPMTGGAGTVVSGYLTVPRKDIRVGCLELESYHGQTLSFLTFSDLKRRDVQNLFLFKANSFGRDGGSLEGRCSLSLAAKDNYLYIRNGKKDSGIVQAEPGDLIMTKEGGFAAIVVELKQDGETPEAKCFVFPDDFRLRNSIRISIDKNKDEKYLNDFDTIGSKLLPRLKELEQK